MSHSEVADYGRIASGELLGARRGVRARVHEVREKLASDTGTRPAFDLELALQFARNRLSAAVLGPLLAVAAAGIGSFWLSTIVLAVWLVVVLTANAAVLLVARRFVSLQHDAASIPRWRRRLALVETAHGLAWAFLVFVPAASPDVVPPPVFFFVLALMVVAVGAMLSAGLPAAVWGGTLPITLALAVLLGTRPDLHAVALAVLAIAGQAYFLILANRLYSGALDTLSMRAEQERLIAELEAAKAQSDEARRRAEAANLAKSRFLATMSHELRTPLNAILGFSEVMKNEILGPLSNENYREYANDIHASGGHLLNLINEILDLSRVEAGRFELNEESVNLVFSVEDCLRLMLIRAQNKGIALKPVFEQGMPTIWADDRAVRQVVLNLVSNAVKFTPSGGTVYVKVGWTAGGGQYVSVRDTGPGIPDDEIPIVLSSFGQGSNALKTAEQGAGLGLPIVRGLVDLHGGTFTFKSKLRVGTEVVVTFPPERVMQALPAVPAGAQQAAA